MPSRTDCRPEKVLSIGTLHSQSSCQAFVIEQSADVEQLNRHGTVMLPWNKRPRDASCRRGQTSRRHRTIVVMEQLPLRSSVSHTIVEARHAPCQSHHHRTPSS